MNKRLSYWGAQIGGWGALMALGLIFQKGSIVYQDIMATLAFITAGIIITHLFRFGIIKLNWLRFSVMKLAPLVLISSVLMGAAFYLSQNVVAELLGRKGGAGNEEVNMVFIIVGDAVFFFLWSVLYFGYHYFEKSRDQEIRNIKLISSRNEVELQDLRTQLNPHFMFNSMNSIRALIDEDPASAKVAVTKLSNLLRSTLIAGKKDLLPLQDELEIVKDYLDLEKIRFEERLDFRFEVEQSLHQKKFPPLLLQTLVENAVKHGISQIAKGGMVLVTGIREGDEMVLNVLNSGTYKPGLTKGSTGIGLENSRRRLDLMFGPEGKLTIGNTENMVKTQIRIPIID
ncbi:MAG: histidine kinase [Flavobacteriales bacterium]|nr:histidine kinase [Flavobacteriales bacterium]